MVRPVRREGHVPPPAASKALKKEAKIVNKIEVKALKSLMNFPKTMDRASQHLKKRRVEWTHEASSSEDKKVIKRLKKMGIL